MYEVFRRWSAPMLGLGLWLRGLTKPASQIGMQVFVSVIEKLELLALIRELYWLSVKYDFRLSASHIPGVDNVLSDGISRMFDIDKALLMKELLLPDPNVCMSCKNHMSEKSFTFLQVAWQRH